MTFPTYTLAASPSSSGSTHSASIPDGVAVGDRVIIFLNKIGNATTITWPAGWTQLVYTDYTGTGRVREIRYRDIDGTEGFTGSGDTIAITLGAARDVRSVAVRVHQGTFSPTTAPAIAVDSGQGITSQSSIALPPLTPPDGAQDYLWLACATSNYTSLSYTAPPTNYSNLTVSGGSNSAIAIATRELNAATEDPGNFTVSGSASTVVHWASATLAIKPMTGTVFTVGVGGSVTPAGSLVRRSRKAVSGSTTAAGTLVRKAARRNLVGSVTSTGAIVRKARKALTSSTTASGALIKKVFIRLVGTQTSSGVFAAGSRRVTIAGSVTAQGALTKVAKRLFDGVTTATGTVANKLLAFITISGSVTSVGTLVRKPLKYLAGSVTTVGTLNQKVKTAYAGSVTAFGTITKKVQRTFTSTTTITGVLWKWLRNRVWTWIPTRVRIIDDRRGVKVIREHETGITQLEGETGVDIIDD